jgi:deoxyribonuclease-4
VALGRALEEASDSDVRILLEDTAGAGGTMGVKFQELGAMIDSVGGDKKVGLCLDTCHLLAAGYDIRTGNGLDAALADLDRWCGMDRLELLHLNDSMTPLGSNRDRHANIGEGELGLEAFRRIVNHPAFEHLPGITEVPGMHEEGPDLENMRRLESLRAR